MSNNADYYLRQYALWSKIDTVDLGCPHSSDFTENHSGSREPCLITDDEARLVDGILCDLGRTDRDLGDAVQLTYLERLKSHQVAERVGVSRPTAEKRISAGIGFVEGAISRERGLYRILGA